jgi:hypothetical protein
MKPKGDHFEGESIDQEVDVFGDRNSVWKLFDHVT